MKKLTLQEIKDTLVGCTILGTGGGGSLESGLEAIEKAWNAGHEFKLLSFDEITMTATMPILIIAVLSSPRAITARNAEMRSPPR